MKKLYSSAAIMLACAVSAYAYDVSLHAVDSQGGDEGYATCRIFLASDSINAKVVGVADSLGYYKASVDTLGDYRLYVEGAGTSAVTTRKFSLTEQTPSLDLGDIVLSPVDQLEEVTVTAQRPLVVKKIDRIGYDVQADPQVLTLSTRDMLRNVPMVSVDGEGNIKVNGSSNFKVFKNGRPNNSMSKNAKEILAAIPASMIKTIEVITQPGAKYDAEGIGAILNIVTVDNAVIKGVLGNASLGYDFWKNMKLGNFYITSQIDKFTFSLSAGLQFQSRKISESSSETDRTYVSSGINEHNTQHMTTRGPVSWLNGEGSWEISKKHLVTFELGGFYFRIKPEGSTFNQRTAADGSLLSSYSSSFHYPNYGYLDFNGNINYQLSTSRSGENFTASYAVSTTDQDNKQSTTYSDVQGDLFNYSEIYEVSALNFIEHTFQADWVRPFGKIHSLEVGGKYILRRNVSNNNTEYVGWTTTNTDFKHITDVGALYAQYTASLKRVSFRAGLRYEYSHLQADFPDGSADSFSSDLNDFVPSAAISWNINDANSLTTHYASRINRPGISYLNPRVSYAPGTVSQGNPDLESAHNNSVDLTYMFINKKVNFNISTNYSFNNDNISSVRYADENGVVYGSYDNVGRERRISFSGFVQWTMTPKTRVMLNASISYNKYMQQDMSLGKWAPNGVFNINQTLPYNIKFNATVYYFGRGNDVYGYYKAVGSKTFGYQMSLSRSFLKGDRLTLSLSATDFIGNKDFKFANITVNGDYVGTTISTMRRGNAIFRVSYRFGSLNASVKKTASKIKNDDLIGRK